MLSNWRLNNLRRASAYLVAPVGLIVLAVLAAGCGGNPAATAKPSDRAAGGAQRSATTNGQSLRKPSRDPQEARLQWAACMRSHGVQIADPDASGNVQIVPGQPQPDPQQFQAAGQKCEYLLANVPPDELQPPPTDSKKMQAQMLRFTHCMRSHGVNLPDPDFSHGATIPPDAFDPNSPVFQKAAAACQRYFPQ